MARGAGRGNGENERLVVGKLDGRGKGNQGRGRRGDFLAMVAVRGVAPYGKVKTMAVLLRELGVGLGQGIGLIRVPSGQGTGGVARLQMHGTAGLEAEVGFCSAPEGEGEQYQDKEAGLAPAEVLEDGHGFYEQLGIGELVQYASIYTMGGRRASILNPSPG